MDDRQLLKNAQHDKRNFSQIYMRYIGKVYKYCYFKLNQNQDNAEDITSQTFVITLEKIDTIYVDRQHNYSMLPYLYTVARNLILKHYQKEGRTVSLDEEIVDIIPDKSISPQSTENEISADDIMKAIGEIDQESRDIVFLKIYEGYKFKEIAQLLNLKEPAVKMRYYRVLEDVTNRANKRLNK